MNVILRDARDGDAEGIAVVHVQAWRESYNDLIAPEVLAGLSVDERVKVWQSALAQPNPRARLVVAVSTDREIVGFARGGPVRSKGADALATDAELFAIYLLDKAKRQGIGRRLMAGVFHHLAAQRFSSVGLWVLKQNLEARRFYEALGGVAGAEKISDMQGRQLVEVAYRFEPIPRL